MFFPINFQINQIYFHQYLSTYLILRFRTDISPLALMSEIMSICPAFFSTVRLLIFTFLPRSPDKTRKIFVGVASDVRLPLISIKINIISTITPITQGSHFLYRGLRENWFAMLLVHTPRIAILIK